MRKTASAILAFVLLFAFAFSGCKKDADKKKGIEGTWILTEEYEQDGNLISSEQLSAMGLSEKYEIEGTKVVYTCETPLSKTPVVIEFVLEDLGNNKYNFNLSSGLTFASPELDGDTMTYELASEGDSIKMVFKRQ